MEGAIDDARGALKDFARLSVLCACACDRLSYSMIRAEEFCHWAPSAHTRHREEAIAR